MALALVFRGSSGIFGGQPKSRRWETRPRMYKIQQHFVSKQLRLSRAQFVMIWRACETLLAHLQGTFTTLLALGVLKVAFWRGLEPSKRLCIDPGGAQGDRAIFQDSRSASRRISLTFCQCPACGQGWIWGGHLPKSPWGDAQWETFSKGLGQIIVMSRREFHRTPPKPKRPTGTV